MTTPTPDNELTPQQKMALSRKLLEAEITARAWEDEAFRKQLEKDPASALAEAGVPLPGQNTIQILMESDSERILVIPQPPPAELCEDELEAVTGGSSKGSAFGGTCDMGNYVKRRFNEGTPDGVIGGVLSGGLLAGMAVVGMSWGWN